MPHSPKVMMGTDSADIYSGGSSKAMAMETDAQSPYCHNKTMPSIFTFNHMPVMLDHHQPIAHNSTPSTTSDLDNSNCVGGEPPSSAGTYLSHFGKGKAQPQQLVAIQLIDTNAKPSLANIVADHDLISNANLSSSTSAIIACFTNQPIITTSSTTTTTTSSTTSMSSTCIITSDIITTNNPTNPNTYNEHFKSAPVAPDDNDDDDEEGTTDDALDDSECDYEDDYEPSESINADAPPPPAIVYETIQIAEQQQPDNSAANLPMTGTATAVKPTTINTNGGGIMVLTHATLSELLNSGGRININTINNNNNNINNSTTSEQQQPKLTQLPNNNNQSTNHSLHPPHSKQPQSTLMINSGALHNHAVSSNAIAATAAAGTASSAGNAAAGAGGGNSAQKQIMFAINNNVSLSNLFSLAGIDIFMPRSKRGGATRLYKISHTDGAL